MWLIVIICVHLIVFRCFDKIREQAEIIATHLVVRFVFHQIVIRY